MKRKFKFLGTKLSSSDLYFHVSRTFMVCRVPLWGWQCSSNEITNPFESYVPFLTPSVKLRIDYFVKYIRVCSVTSDNFNYLQFEDTYNDLFA